MVSNLNRRDFLAATAAATAATVLPNIVSPNISSGATFKTKIHKAIIGMPTEASLSALKEAGFEGMESTDRGASPEKAEGAGKTAEKIGVRIHSVMYGWANFNNPGSFEGDLKSVETALRASHAYGADTVLMVPCKIGGLMPKAWEFDIRFDDKTGKLKQVVAGDNAKYHDYIETHNRSAEASREAIQRLIPVAEKLGIILAIENVWNNMWVKPEFFRNFVASFDNPWLRAYYDIGNHVKYAPPEQWVETLGKLIVKLHVKDFKLGPEGHDGKFVEIRDGSVNWPAVRKALDKIGYAGWGSIEGSSLPLAEQSRRYDLILSGE